MGEIAKGLIEAGVDVALVDLAEAIDNEIVNELGDKAQAFCCDLSDKIPKMLEYHAHFGHILYNTAVTKTSNPKTFAPFESYY